MHRLTVSERKKSQKIIITNSCVCAPWLIISERGKITKNKLTVSERNITKK